jgi:cobalt-zinc-cadmium efflux system outer membrane protein
LDRQIAAQAALRLEHQLAAQRWRVINDVRAQYLEVLAAQQQVDLSGRLLELANRWATAAEGLRKIGEFSEIELLQARIEADQAQLTVQNAQHRHVAAWRRLASLAGVPDSPPTPLAGRLDQPPGHGDRPDWQSVLHRDWNAALENLLANSPEIARSAAGVQEARAALDRAHAEPLPDVTVQASVQYDAATLDTIASVQAGVPLPVWHQFQGRITQAEAELAAAQHDWQATRLALAARLAEAFQRYEIARGRVLTYRRDILPKTRQSQELVQKAYDAQVGQFNTLLTAQRTFFAANQQYIEAQKELQQSLVAIDGLVLGDSFQANVEP